MILVIPKIELRGGESNLVICGENDVNFNSFCKDPVNLLQLMRKENAKTLHISDYDSLNGQDHLLNLNSVLYFQDCIDIPIEYESNIISYEIAKLLLDNGIYRIFVSDVLFIDAQIIGNLITQYRSSRIAVSFNYDGNQFTSVSGNFHRQLDELLESILAVNCCRILIKIDDNDKDNITQLLDKLGHKFRDKKIHVTIGCDVDSFQILIDLDKYVNNYFDSIIIGKPLYENKFSCQKIWRKIEAKLENLN